jgi:hypothetical protein
MARLGREAKEAKALHSSIQKTGRSGVELLLKNLEQSVRQIEKRRDDFHERLKVFDEEAEVVRDEV